jgi:hypothetical protein
MNNSEIETLKNLSLEGLNSILSNVNITIIEEDFHLIKLIIEEDILP